MQLERLLGEGSEVGRTRSPPSPAGTGLPCTPQSSGHAAAPSLQHERKGTESTYGCTSWRKEQPASMTHATVPRGLAELSVMPHDSLRAAHHSFIRQTWRTSGKRLWSRQAAQRNGTEPNLHPLPVRSRLGGAKERIAAGYDHDFAACAPACQLAWCGFILGLRQVPSPHC